MKPLTRIAWVRNFNLLLLSLILALVGITSGISAQEVNVSVSYDTVYAGNLLAIQFTMENWQAELIEPDFGVFEKAGGPQMTSSMSYSGGQRSSTKSIIYFLKPPERQGEYLLPEQLFKGEGKEASTDEKKIFVMDNPDQIQQNPTIQNNSPRGFNRQYKRKEPPRGQRQRF